MTTPQGEMRAVQDVPFMDELVGDGTKVRYTPPAPLGTGGAISAFQVAEFGAQLAASGLEKGAVTAFMHEIQAIAVKTSLEALPALLNKLQEAMRSRINRVMQDVQAMQGVEVPVVPLGMLARAVGAQGQTATYVSKETVLRLLAVAMERGASTS